MMTRHIFITILIAALVSFGTYKIAAPESDIAAEKKETAYERVLRTGTLRCGYAMYPPSLLVKDANTGKLSGAMVDIIEEMAENLSLKVEWTEETGWGTWPESLKTGRFDMFCTSAYQTASRGRLARYISPVFYDSVFAYVRADDMRFDGGLDKLDDPQFKISMMDGEISAKIPEKHFPKATRISIPQLAQFDQLLLNVTTHKADIVFTAPTLANDFMRKNPGQLKRLTDEPFQVFGSAFAVAMTEVHLAAMIDSALVEMQNSGDVDRIFTRHGIPGDELLRVAKPYHD